MTLWLVFALMTAAAIFAVLWPLGRSGAVVGGSDIVVYRDQLDEIERDRAAGLIGEAEADAAKVEVSRQLIAAADAAAEIGPVSDGYSLWRRRGAAIAGLLLLPFGAAAFYLMLGSPELPGKPLAARHAAARGQSIESLISQVEAHLEHNPQDARGYEVLAPVYLRLGRFTEAVNARRELLALGDENAERQSDLGEALTAASNGVVTTEAKTAFERAQALDATDLKSKFYLGVAAEQDGQRDKAAAIWRSMLTNAPPGAPWIAAVREALTRVGAAAPPVAAAPGPGAPGPSAADVAAASGMSEQDRSDMIRGMVARLADKLKTDGNDIDGWLRLVRAYMVLGERDKAKTAAADARRAMAKEPDKIRQIDNLVKELGFEG
jgi:cytochrome c-type biogenesis protein CcmH